MLKYNNIVSVVIPTYNNAAYIVQALESVLSQTYKDYEIILIDDGSTDETKDIIKPYLKVLKYHYQENRGLAVARNVGLEMASGEYVTFLDGDDIWEPDNLLLKTEILYRKPELGGVFSEFTVFDSEKILHQRGSKSTFPFFKRTQKYFKDIFNTAEVISINSKKQITLYSGKVFDELFMGNFILPTSMVFRKECADIVGRFLPHLRTQQDYEYWLRFSKKYPFGYIDEPLVRYRRHANQLTNFANINKIINNVLEIIDQYEQEFDSQGRKYIFNRRKAEILKDLAKVNIRLRKTDNARASLAKSMLLNPWIIQNYFFYCLSYLPEGAMRQGVKIYRNIRAYTDELKR